MRLIMVGPPGAGKGTQATLLSKKYGVPTISTGDLFRARVKDPNDPLGKQISEIMKGGNLVPDDITVKMLAERIEQADCKNGFILDGFPRTVAQAQALEKMLKEKSVTLDAVIKLDVDDDKLVERISGRFSCGDCNEGYHDTFKKPHDPHACDKCGAKDHWKRRPDDNEATVRERLVNYHSYTEKIVPFYDERGLLRTVDGMAGMDNVTKQIESALDSATGGAKIVPPPKKFG
jgi:adenylate kinase